jgi:hypothetical protein
MDPVASPLTIAWQGSLAVTWAGNEICGLKTHALLIFHHFLQSRFSKTSMMTVGKKTSSFQKQVVFKNKYDDSR